MPKLYIGDLQNKPIRLKKMYIGNTDNRPLRLKKIWCGDPNNRPLLIFADEFKASSVLSRPTAECNNQGFTWSTSFGYDEREVATFYLESGKKYLIHLGFVLWGRQIGDPYVNAGGLKIDGVQYLGMNPGGWPFYTFEQDIVVPGGITYPVFGNWIWNGDNKTHKLTVWVNTVNSEQGQSVPHYPIVLDVTDLYNMVSKDANTLYRLIFNKSKVIMAPGAIDDDAHYYIPDNVQFDLD